MGFKQVLKRGPKKNHIPNERGTKQIQERVTEIRERELQERAEAYIAEVKLPMGKALTILIEQEQIKRGVQLHTTTTREKEVRIINKANCTRREKSRRHRKYS